MTKKVLVGTPTTSDKSYALARYLYVLKNLTYDCDVLLIDNSEDPEYSALIEQYGISVLRTPHMDNPYEQLILARNTLRKRAIEGGYDYLLSLESDVIPSLDIVEKLLRHKKDYVTAYMDNYILLPNKIKKMPVIRREFSDTPGRYYDLTEEERQEGDLIEIGRAHLGCTLISTEALKKVEFRHDEWQYDDYLLCDDLRAAGYKLFCDTTIDIFHMCDGGSLHVRARKWRKEQEKS
ncbi:hypothetical protein GOV10_02770 [Candidatus Woesearchaeota archaeon]|nr:hypothetical protein [Candidatus Woesearchaeota archaeon]